VPNKQLYCADIVAVVGGFGAVNAKNIKRFEQVLEAYLAV
jgi:hypothetical protein